MTNPAETPVEPTPETLAPPDAPTTDSSVRASTLDSMPAMDEPVKPAVKSNKGLFILAGVVMFVIVALVVVLVVVLASPRGTEPTPTPTPTNSATPTLTSSPTVTTTSTPSVTTSVTPTTALTKMSNAENSPVKMMIPESWTFKNMEITADDDEGFGFEVFSNSSSDIKITVTNFGRGGPCEPGEDTDPCLESAFHENSLVKYTLFRQGTSGEIIGTPKPAALQGDFTIFISYKDIGTKDLSASDKDLVVQILDSLELL